MEFADDYGQEFFFQDEYDDSLPLAMAAVDDNIITFKYVIFIFLTVKKPNLAPPFCTHEQKQNVYY